ncbi:hypothetical protein C1646_763312 [Rhizophagus diaphanus]|nr:hypothetical protein C1646_763312 [Rhizophagus diaphanus] [Rhizophagus sp. MUCL 43196]
MNKIKFTLLQISSRNLFSLQSTILIIKMSIPITIAGPSTSRASASQTLFSQMDENLVYIAEDSEIPEDTDDIDPKDTNDIDPENTDDIDSEDADNIDSKDLQGASLDDALDTIEGKNVSKRIAEWPNVAYRDFLELIVEGNISNKMGDKIINFFNKHSNLEKSPLLSSTKKGKDYLNQINSPLGSLKKINDGEDKIRVFGELMKATGG